MKDLGAKIAMSAKDKPTVCVTDKLRRTEKFMCALGSGIPIVSKDWVINCKRSKKILGNVYQSTLLSILNLIKIRSTNGGFESLQNLKIPPFLFQILSPIY